ncbi:MAG: hypothetical protein HS100_13740 [Anaerolineales bacterium]|nr:hypothetical protein [Anaerolineales bacterium]
MLKPMKPQSGMPRNMFLWILVGLLVISGIVALVSAFDGGSDGTEEVNAVYTNAAATLAAQQLLSSPTSTATATAGTPTATATFIPLASPTLFTSQILPTNTSGAASGAVGCNNSAYVADVTIPDNTVVNPGQTITKTWKLQNTGSCAWTPTYKVSFVSGNAMSGVATPIGITVQPGQSGDVTVTLKAPTTTGDVRGDWILTNDSGQNFGSTFYILVKVSGAATTGTATVTATATATSAPSAPAPANNPNITLTCALEGGVGPRMEHAGTLTWEDKSNNETGFNIYINGVLVTTTTENVTSYIVPSGTYYDPGVTSTFSVEAFNTVGKATAVSVIKSCP